MSTLPGEGSKRRFPRFGRSPMREVRYLQVAMNDLPPDSLFHPENRAGRYHSPERQRVITEYRNRTRPTAPSEPEPSIAELAAEWEAFLAKWPVLNYEPSDY